MRPTTSNEIRKAFLDFFDELKHKVVPSAPLPQRDHQSPHRPRALRPMGETATAATRAPVIRRTPSPVATPGQG